MKMNKMVYQLQQSQRKLSSISGFFEWQIQHNFREGDKPCKGKIAPKIRHETKKLTRKTTR